MSAVGKHGSNDPNGTHDVLEDNLQRLFRRAYVPVVPTAVFRTRLESELERFAERQPAVPFERVRVERVRRDTDASSPIRARSRSRMALAAAVLVVACGIWFAIVHSKHTATFALQDVLARGSVAVRDPSATAWRPLDPREVRSGIDVDHTALEVATPDRCDVRLRFGSHGQALLAPSSQAAFDAGAQAEVAPLGAKVTAPATVMDLTSGALVVERYGSGPDWTLTGCGARIEIERGEIELSVADASAFGAGSGRSASTPSASKQPVSTAGSSPATGMCLVVHLTRGVARAWIDGALVPITVGTRLALQSGRALEARIEIDDPEARGVRAPAVVESQSATPGTDATATKPETVTTARLEARLLPPPGLARPSQCTVTLLRHERLPAVTQPIRRDFAVSERFTIDGLRPGMYDIFVETAGFAVWRTSDIEIGAGAVRAIDVQLALGLSLRGRVVDAATGAPVEGAIVLSEDDVPARVIPFALDEMPKWSAAASTLSDGTFELLHLRPGSCVLRATHAGFGATWSAPVDPALANDPITLRLGHGGSVTGHVLRDQGSAWSSAIIIASHLGRDGTGGSSPMARMGYGIAYTSASGDYRIDDLPEGSFVVLNELDMTNSSSVRQATVVAGKTITVDLPERATGARITGTLFDHAGKPIADKDVTLQPVGTHDRTGWRSLRSDALGRFAFEGVREGAFDVYIGTEMGRRFVRQDRVDVPASGEVVHDVHLDAGSINGRVVRADDGSACNQCFLLIREKQLDGDFGFAGIDCADMDGNFAIDHLRQGTWRIFAYPSEHGLAPRSSGDLVVTDEPGELQCTIRVPRGAALRVRVRDADGRAVADAAVDFVDADGDAVQLTALDVTGQAGVLDVPGIAAGKWSLKAHIDGRASTIKSFDFVPGEDREIELVLER